MHGPADEARQPERQGRKMKLKSQQLNLALAIGALVVLQGCAQTGGTMPDTAQTASVPVQTTTASGSVSATAAIPENDGKPVVTANTKDNFEAVAAAIRKEMQPGGRFAFVTKAGRQTVETGLTDMGTLFDQCGGVDKMGPAAQGKLLEDQNAINEILARYDANRRICWKETPRSEEHTSELQSPVHLVCRLLLEK